MGCLQKRINHPHLSCSAEIRTATIPGICERSSDIRCQLGWVLIRKAKLGRSRANTCNSKASSCYLYLPNQTFSARDPQTNDFLFCDVQMHTLHCSLNRGKNDVQIVLAREGGRPRGRIKERVHKEGAFENS